MNALTHDQLLQRIETLNAIGMALSGEAETARLFELVLDGARQLTRADGASLYLMNASGRSLRFEVVRTASLELSMGGAEGHPVLFPIIHLYEADGSPNLHMVVTAAVHQDRTINITDAYRAEGYDFSGTREFDGHTGYRSHSFLTVPMKNHEGEVLGVLQLINKLDDRSGEVIGFDEDDQGLVESLASQTAVALTAKRMMEVLESIDRLNEVGVALSAEKDFDHLLESILLGAKEITHADGGTIYLRADGSDHLDFAIVRNDTLDIALGGTTGAPINFPPVPLYKEDGSPNEQMVAAYAVLHDSTINIADAYATDRFDFSGTRAFDARTGYRSTSFLTIPLKNHLDEIIGALQLINKMDQETGEVIQFRKGEQRLAESLASQAAVAMTNKRLLDDLRRLFESFIQMVADAIDEKSPYTGGHCRRVPELTLMLADAAARSDVGILKEFSMDEERRYELEIAAWLHDCGKVATPEYVVDKSTKLETIHDRVHEVETRFEVLKRDAEIRMLRRRLEAGEAGREAIEAEYRAELEQLEAERAFIHRANIGGEFMTEEDQQRVRQIGARSWSNDGKRRTLLSENEIYNLNIAKGTLTPEEREVINNHVKVTIKMLEALPFPKHLKNVPEYAGGHHERVDGKGYPRGLTREQMSVQARVMAIADIFEALTAKDRPYKEGKKLSQALKIMGFMNKEGHIDPDLFQVFIHDKVYLDYAERFLGPEQIDEVDPAQIPGFVPYTPSAGLGG